MARSRDRLRQCAGVREETAQAGEAPSYLFVVPVPAYPIDETRFAIESAFAEHLILLRDRLGPLARNVVIAAPQMPQDDYERSKSSLAVLDRTKDGIRFAPIFPNDISRLGYLAALPRVLAKLRQEMKGAHVVHTGPSGIYRMFEFPAFLMASLSGKVTIGVSDIDARMTPAMNLRTGHWNRRQYWVNRLVHMPIAHLQHAAMARMGSVVLYKGAKLARDYGNGRDNVKNILDAAYSAEDIILPDELAAKLEEVRHAQSRLRICYFGRLTRYKGIDHMLRALVHARTLGLNDFVFDVIGDGDARPALEALASELGLTDVTHFHGQMPFGREFLRRLRQYHVLLAAPLREDTPRSALDAMASGQAVLAYDTYYYRDLAEAGAGVETVPWFEPEALGRRLHEISQDRAQLAHLIERSVSFAHANTQAIWLDRRAQWTQEAVRRKFGSPPGRSAPSTGSAQPR